MELGLIIKNDKVVVSSRKVAEIYEKQHKDVLKKIRSFILEAPELDGRNFTLVDYEDSKGEYRPEYIMDRQGFSIIVNKFTGSKALKFTIKYTDAFEEMSKKLNRPLSPAQILMQQAQFMIEQERINEELKVKNKLLEETQHKQQIELEEVKDKINRSTVVREGDMTAEVVAKRLNIFSLSNKPHINFAESVAMDLGFYLKPSGNVGYQDEYITINLSQRGGRDIPTLKFSEKAFEEIEKYMEEGNYIIEEPPRYFKRGDKKGKYNFTYMCFGSDDNRIKINETTYKLYSDKCNSI